MPGQLSLMSDQVTVWSDKVQAAMLKLFSSLSQHCRAQWDERKAAEGTLVAALVVVLRSSP